MRVLSLGDSVLIDDYTGKAGGGAASQFARMIGADELEQTAGDGIGLARAYEILRSVDTIPDVVLFCCGGNDLLKFAWARDEQTADDAFEAMITTFDAIMERIVMYGCITLACTYFDPTDGDGALSLEMGFREESRDLLHRYNDYVGSYPGVGIVDMFPLFKGKGLNRPGSYIALGVELNLRGATALAKEMYEVYKTIRVGPGKGSN
jgi:lysophospholipase L1-like esterase